MNLPAYPKYKDSGVAWLGKVPEGWEVKRLRYICTIETGSKDTIDAIDDAEYPFFVRSQTVEKIDTYTYNCEAVLTAGDGVGVGKVFHHYCGKFEAHQRVYVLHSFFNCLSRFLYYHMKENFAAVALEGNAKSTVDSLRRNNFTDFIVPLPSLPEQEAIAAFLDRETAKIDALVEKQQRMLDLLKEKRTALISHAVTKGLNPNAKLKDSGVAWLGMVPEGWEAWKLNHICLKIIDGTHFSPESSPSGDRLYITAKNIKEHGIDLTNISYVSEEDHKGIYARCPVMKGDVLYIKDGATAGIATVNMLDEEFSLLSSVAVLRANKSMLDQNYLAYQLNTEEFKKYVLKSLVGGAMTRFTLEIISKFEIVCPLLPEQQAIVAFLDCETAKIDTLAAHIEDMIAKLQEYRTALITAAVTGKVNVQNM